MGMPFEVVAQCDPATWSARYCCDWVCELWLREVVVRYLDLATLPTPFDMRHGDVAKAHLQFHAAEVLEVAQDHSRHEDELFLRFGDPSAGDEVLDQLSTERRIAV